MQTTIILLVEQIVTALGGEFKVIRVYYLSYNDSTEHLTCNSNTDHSSSSSRCDSFLGITGLIAKYQLNSLHSVDLSASDHPSDT